jgi:hypothetical protein
MKGGAALHLNRRAWMVRENKYRFVIRRIVTPPALPLVIGPWAADRPEHIASQDPRADPVRRARRKIIVNARRAVLTALHPLKRARGDEPLMQVFATNAQRIIEALIGACAKPIERYCKTMNT